MKLRRREFLKGTGTTAATMLILPAAFWLGQAPDEKRGSTPVLKTLSIINDAKIQDLLTMQIHDPSGRWHGGVKNNDNIPNAHSTCWFIVWLGSAYSSRYSDYYLSPALELPIELAARCLKHIQYPDGTVDLYSTNFHSTPDTAFIVNYLSPVYQVLSRLDQPGLENTLKHLEIFFSEAGTCLKTGGIHTPNHRWVVCSALAWMYQFEPDPRYLDRMDQWLREGVDMDPDGQYTEQSVSIYSPLCNNMFLTMGRLLNRPEYYDIVRKNLDMTLYYIQPGGEVLTDASGRQDSARVGYVDKYYFAYKYFANQDKNGQYAAVCNLIEQVMPERITRYMPELLDLPELQEVQVAPTRIPDNYFKRFKHSGIFRIRRGRRDISVIERNPTFLAIMKGEAVLQSVRLHAAFFGSRGQFISQDSEVEGGKILLRKSETHGYYQPFPEEDIPQGGDWEKMPRSERTMSEIQTLNYQVSIIESNGRVTMEIDIRGTANVPVSMELSFREKGLLSGVESHETLDHAYFLENGTGEYSVGSDTIRFGPGITEHTWAQMRGMLPKQNGKSVYLTGYTPFQHTIEFS